MKTYAVIDQTTKKVTTALIAGIHEIPSDAVLLTETQYFELTQNNFMRTLENGVLAVYVPPYIKEIPQVITPRQVRLILSKYGLRQAVEDMIAQADIDTKDYWEYSLEIRRDNAILIALGTSLGLTSEQLDDMFIEASTM